jgi:competence protein ComFB
MELKNLMEEVVRSALEDVWANEKMCKCEKCRLDILAKALNKLPPRYLVTDRGKIFSRADFLELQKRIDVIASLAHAVRLVKSNPRH